jgi:hypothetical protein
MPNLLHQQAVGQCSHGATARPLVGNPRVKLSGQPVLTVVSRLSVSNCPNVVGTTRFPCVFATYATGARRVKVMGQPVLLENSKALNLPTGASTTIKQTQQRVKGV